MDDFLNTVFSHEQEEKISNVLLRERLNLTLAFCKRYRMSSAFCYLRLHYPQDISRNKTDRRIETLANVIETRLRGSIRDIDTVIRIDKSDFIIVLTDITEVECNQLCKRIIKSITDTYIIDFNHFSIGCNMGICMFPYGSEKMEELLSIAKLQAYEAETIGINQYSIFKDKISESAYRKMIIENDLPYAIKKDQMYIVFQPQLSIKNRKINGVESLIRWKHPSLGEVYPNEFIDFATKVGVMNDIFFWVFEEICKNIAKAGKSEIKYSINLSVYQLLLDFFEQRITSILQKYSVSANRITLEITEDIEVYSLNQVKQKLQSLKDKCFSIALDDFGNGYFSFISFIHLPIDVIKLDKEFVTSLLTDKKHRPVISSIITMAHHLGLDVVVEGVEDYNQFSDWLDLECDTIQGYFISKPISHSQLLASVDDIENRAQTILNN